MKKAAHGGVDVNRRTPPSAELAVAVADDEESVASLLGKDASELKRRTPRRSRLPFRGFWRLCGWSKLFVAGTVAVSGALIALTTFMVAHVAVTRAAAVGRLDDVLAIFQGARYYPILNGFHSHHPDMRDRYSRALAAIGVSKVPLHQRHASQPPCVVTYSMNITEAEAKTVDLDQYDQELLGTIMVRLCQCRCGGTVTPPLNESLSLFAEILRGAHVVVEDDRGSFYAWFTQMQDSYRRTSSHMSIVPMYGIPEGSVLRTMLTGRDLGGNTWFQMEGAMWAPFRHPFDSLVHSVNYIQYKLTGRQVGPLGTSLHTDRNPIKLRWDGCRDAHRVLFKEFDPEDPTGKAPVRRGGLGLFTGATMSFRRGVDRDTDVHVLPVPLMT